MSKHIRVGDLTIHESLAVVTLAGFAGEPEYETQIDEPGSANWLCERYGMAPDDLDYDGMGILWTDYDFNGGGDTWKFAVLIDGDAAADLIRFAEEAGYTHVGTDPVTEPDLFGDGGGTCSFLRHRDGWIVLPN